MATAYCAPRYNLSGILIVAIVALGARLGIAQIADRPTRDRETAGDAHDASPDAGGMKALMALEDALVQTIADCEKSVVAVACTKVADVSSLPPAPPTESTIPYQFGAGVVVDRRGLILTQYHLLSPGDAHWVTTYERRTYPAEIKAADPRSGLAVLAIHADNLTPIKLGDADELRKGQLVVTLGNPYTIARDGQASASWGIIANLARKAGPLVAEYQPLDEPENKRPTLHHFGTLIQTDAKLNLGTSGGALINLRGQMIGLTTSVAATAGFEQAAGYAVPINRWTKRFIDALKDGREVEYGVLGVIPDPLPSDLVQAGRRGILVGSVVPATPAAAANLTSGDVITHVDGQPIGDPDELILKISLRPVEAKVRLRYERGEQANEVTVRLAKYPVEGRKIVTNAPPTWRGLSVDYATAAPEFQRLALEGRVDPQGSVVVTDVVEDSPAWKEGLRPNMFISHVEGDRVRRPDEFRRAVTGHDGPVRLRLTLPDEQHPERRIPPEV